MPKGKDDGTPSSRDAETCSKSLETTSYAFGGFNMDVTDDRHEISSHCDTGRRIRPKSVNASMCGPSTSMPIPFRRIEAEQRFESSKGNVPRSATPANSQRPSMNQGAGNEDEHSTIGLGVDLDDEVEIPGLKKGQLMRLSPSRDATTSSLSSSSRSESKRSPSPKRLRPPQTVIISSNTPKSTSPVVVPQTKQQTIPKPQPPSQKYQPPKQEIAKPRSPTSKIATTLPFYAPEQLANSELVKSDTAQLLGGIQILDFVDIKTEPETNQNRIMSAAPVRSTPINQGENKSSSSGSRSSGRSQDNPGDGTNRKTLRRKGSTSGSGMPRQHRKKTSSRPQQRTQSQSPTPKEKHLKSALKKNSIYEKFVPEKVAPFRPKKRGVSFRENLVEIKVFDKHLPPEEFTQRE